MRRATEETIADLDKVIAELISHRDRLAATVKSGEAHRIAA